jgi:hypothetical protein
MKSEDEKSRRKQLLKELKQKEKEAFISKLPAEIHLFTELFDYLDERLEEEGCDHTLQLTEDFLVDKNIDKDAVIKWLNDNGGYCDCEVLNNVEENFENL